MEVDLESVRRPRIAKRGNSTTIDFFVDDAGNVLAEEIFNNYTAAAMPGGDGRVRQPAHRRCDALIHRRRPKT